MQASALRMTVPRKSSQVEVGLQDIYGAALERKVVAESNVEKKTKHQNKVN